MIAYPATNLNAVSDGPLCRSKHSASRGAACGARGSLESQDTALHQLRTVSSQLLERRERGQADVAMTA